MFTEFVKSYGDRQLLEHLAKLTGMDTNNPKVVPVTSKDSEVRRLIDNASKLVPCVRFVRVDRPYSKKSMQCKTTA